MAVMPMFPLGTVLFPTALLPLRVFEPRYRQMILDLLHGGVEPEFGVVLIERGREVGGGDVRAHVGTVARMLQVTRHDDSRYTVLCVGARRIRVLSWLEDDPYPRADVEDWPDERPDGVAPAQLAEVTAAVRRAMTLASELESVPMHALDEIVDDPVVASCQLAALAPVGQFDQFALLSAPSPSARLALLAEQLVSAEELLRFRLSADGPTLPDEWAN